MLGAFDLVPIEIGPAVLVLTQIGRKALGREELAGALGMIGLQRRELGLEGLEQLGTAPLLPLGFFAIKAENVATSALAIPENHLLGAQIRGDRGVAARVGQDLVPDLLDPANRGGEDVFAGTLGQLLEIGFGIEPGVADEERAAEAHVAEIVLDARDGGDVRRVARENP
jgi:hypothetical protein